MRWSPVCAVGGQQNHGRYPGQRRRQFRLHLFRRSLQPSDFSGDRLTAQAGLRRRQDRFERDRADAQGQGIDGAFRCSRVLDEASRRAVRHRLRSSSCVFITIGPYHATGSSSGLPDTSRKRMPSSPGLHHDFVAAIEQDQRVIARVVTRRPRLASAPLGQHCARVRRVAESAACPRTRTRTHCASSPLAAASSWPGGTEMSR